MAGPRRSWPGAILAVGVRPWLWLTALVSMREVARPGWWRRAPFLPRPDPAYLAFRMETQYGADAAPNGADLVRFLEWTRAQRTMVRGRRR